jgi:hypothetical protein
MAKDDYLPAKDSEFLLWHDQFKAALTPLLQPFGFTPAEGVALDGDNVDLHDGIALVLTTAAASKQAVSQKNDTRSAAEERVRAYARRIKAHTGYTVAQGQQFGIEGPEDTTDLTTSKPTLAGTAKSGGSVEITFNKSKSEGVNIYCLRPGDAASTFLARDTSSPYVDNRPLLVAGKPEVREYRAIYVLNDAEIGNFSDEIVITATP